jgi:hypothetical protein
MALGRIRKLRDTGYARGTQGATGYARGTQGATGYVKGTRRDTEFVPRDAALGLGVDAPGEAPGNRDEAPGASGSREAVDNPWRAGRYPVIVYR